MLRNDRVVTLFVWLHCRGETNMTKFGILGATALSLSLAIAAPALAQQEHGGRATARVSAGNMGRPAFGAGPRVQSNFQGAQANVSRTNFAGVSRTNFAGRSNAQFAEGDRGVLGGGQFRDDRGRGFRRGAGFAAGAAAAGVATGAAIAASDYGYGYDPYYYGDNYAYDTGYYGDSYAFDAGPAVAFDQPVAVEGPVVADASYCAQRYRSYDPASGTYLGFDGLRHPCP
jgi:hypothetical protein